LDDSGSYAKMETYSNFLIKVVISSDYGVYSAGITSGSILGDLGSDCTTSNLKVGDSRGDLEVVGDLEGK